MSEESEGKSESKQSSSTAPLSWKDIGLLTVIACVALAFLFCLGQAENKYRESTEESAKWEAFTKEALLQNGAQMAYEMAASAVPATADFNAKLNQYNTNLEALRQECCVGSAASHAASGASATSGVATAKSGSLENYWSELQHSAFDETGSLHGVYRMAIALLTMIVGLAVILILLRFAPKSVTAYTDKIGDALAAGGEAAKSALGVALVGSVAAVPIYSAYHAVQSPSSVTRSNSYSQVSLAELIRLQTELAHEVQALSSIQSSVNAGLEKQSKLRDEASTLHIKTEALLDANKSATASSLQKAAQSIGDAASAVSVAIKDSIQQNSNTLTALSNHQQELGSQQRAVMLSQDVANQSLAQAIFPFTLGAHTHSKDAPSGLHPACGEFKTLLDHGKPTVDSVQLDILLTKWLRPSYYLPSSKTDQETVRGNLCRAFVSNCQPDVKPEEVSKCPVAKSQ